VPVKPDRLHVRVLQLRIELEGLEIEVINVGERIRSLERLLLMVPAVPLLLHPDAVSDAVPDDVPLLLHPDADASCTLDLARLLAVLGMCWLTSLPPNFC